MRRTFRHFGLCALPIALAAVAIEPPGLAAQTSKPTIWMVHGAFADGSSWHRVIPILQRGGCPVIAVQNPLTSLADDIPTTERAVEAQTGSIVLVGHSYGGASVPEAAWNTIPSWSLVAQDDRAINPELQGFYVRRMGARSTEVKSSHVPFLSHPAEVARVIEAAAASR